MISRCAPVVVSVNAVVRHRLLIGLVAVMNAMVAQATSKQTMQLPMVAQATSKQTVQLPMVAQATRKQTMQLPMVAQATSKQTVQLPMVAQATSKKTMQLPMQAQKNYFSERCFTLELGQQLAYQLSTSHPVEFNLHHHRSDGETVYPDKLVVKSQHLKQLIADSAGVYCFMATNLNDQPSDFDVVIDYQITAP